MLRPNSQLFQSGIKTPRGPCADTLKSGRYFFKVFSVKIMETIAFLRFKEALFTGPGS